MHVDAVNPLDSYPHLRVSGIIKSYDDLPVLRSIDLTVSSGEIICLLGPSGCGKTTLLRIIAGLETPDSGSVLLDEQPITHQPVHQRGFGLMFQDHALFPHMNVAQNIAFGLKMRGQSSAAQKSRVSELLSLVDLVGYEKRDVATLSGGEKQRVALARSLAPNPPLLMLDEPLGALDAALRERLVVDLRAIIKRIGLTAIYVTHDRQEAFAIADRIAVMNAGRIEQIAPPPQIYQRPAAAFVARFLGLGNIIPVTAVHEGVAQTSIGTFPVSGSPSALLIHPDGITLAPNFSPSLTERGLGGEVALTATIDSLRYEGSTYQLAVKLPSGETLLFDQPARTVADLQMGATISLTIDPSAIIPLTA